MGRLAYLLNWYVFNNIMEQMLLYLEVGLVFIL